MNRLAFNLVLAAACTAGGYFGSRTIVAASNDLVDCRAALAAQQGPPLPRFDPADPLSCRNLASAVGLNGVVFYVARPGGTPELAGEAVITCGPDRIRVDIPVRARLGLDAGNVP